MLRANHGGIASGLPRRGGEAASYKLPLQVHAAKIVIDDPFELKYEAASCCCKDSVLTKQRAAA